MSDYSITFARSARKELQALDSKVIGRVLSKIESLSQDPRPSGCRKLRGTADLWRVRVGDYRVVYSIDDAARAVDISLVRHRRDAYR